MKYAVIQTGGKQYTVKEGDVVEIEHLKASKDSDFQMSEVLLYSADGQTKVGMPFVTGVTVSGKFLDEKKGVKIRVAKFKAKARHRRVTGHRQLLSVVRIDSISVAGEKKKETAAPAAVTEKKTEKKVTRKSAKPSEKV